MGQIVNKVLFRYILLLLLTFVSSIVLAIGIHLFFYHFGEEFQAKITNLEAKNSINNYILYDIQNLHVSFLALGATTDSKSKRDYMIRTIKNDIMAIEKSINILHNGGTFTKKISASDSHIITLTYTSAQANLEKRATHAVVEFQLMHLERILEHLENLYTQRETYLKENNDQIPTLIHEIRTTNANLTFIFDTLLNEMKTIIIAENKSHHALIAENKTNQGTYHYYELLLMLITSLAVFFGMYRIIQQIIKLYQELENKLYTDALTKLDNRFALIRDIKVIQNPGLIIVDINSFKTINELYGVDVGNDVLINFAQTLKSFASLKHLKLYRIAGDEFVFLKDVSHHDTSSYISIINEFFHTVENKPILLKQLDDALYLDLTAGISFDKKNTLGTADIALNRAKELHQPFVFYHDSLDSINEITQGVLWKKRIITGLENNLFLPFFQPIVNREQTTVKYEALMRLEYEVEREKSFIAPFEFLEIASKTKHYDAVSKMTLFKSLALCVEKNITVTLNLNYQDILNQSLHEELKKYILSHNIGKRIIFEIVESQHVKSYALLKSFMETFKPYGVRFAIDDFGTGFSNFSHIFELSPDFIKIDGSLIKNIHIDKKSYELVKAIVFFSQELDIKTVAEYVHCKEVFDITYALGIDFFQGYYFGKPEPL